MLNIKNDLVRFEGMHLRQNSNKKKLIMFALVFALIGTYFLIRAFALEPSLTGDLSVIHADSFADKKTSLSYILKTADGQTIPLSINGAEEGQFYSGKVQINGIGSSTKSKSLNVNTSQVKQTATTTVSTGQHKVAIIMYRFPDDSVNPPISVDALRADIFTGTKSTNAFIKEESNSNVSLTGLNRTDGDIFGYYLLSHRPVGSECSPDYGAAIDSISQQLNALAKNDGHDLSGYQHVVYAAPGRLCGWGGMGEVVGTKVWTSLTDVVRVTPHELTHNFGTDHANFLDCRVLGKAVPIAKNCTVVEYGDTYDVMGSGVSTAATPLPLHSSNYFQQSLGWLKDSDVRIVKASGTYTLSPQEAKSGTKLLRIYRTATDVGPQYYDLEYRQPIGFDSQIANTDVYNGVTVRLDHVKSGDTAYVTGIVSTHPLLVNGLSATGGEQMQDGQSFFDPDYKIMIKQVSHKASEVKLQVTLSTSDTIPPVQVTGLSASPSISPSGASTVYLQWNATTDNVGINSYDVYRSTSATTGFTKIGSGQVNSSGLDSQPATYYYLDNAPGATTFYYYIIATDTSGNPSPKSATVSIKSPGTDTTPPSAPTSVVATGASASQINLTWAAATDNVGVDHYIVKRNGNAVGTPTTTSYSDTGLNAATTYTYSVFAVDAAGNQNVYNVSQTATGTTKTAVDTTPPSAPTGVVATATSTSRVGLTWTASTDNVGVTYYTVYRNGNSVGTATTTSYTDTGLAQLTTYTYSVYAYDAAGNHNVYNVSQTATATTQGDGTPPSAPTSVVATATSTTQIGITWSPSTDNVGISYYKVYRNGNSVGQTSSTSFTDSGLSPSTTYTYSIYAYDAAGNHNVYNASQTATGTTKTPVDSSPPTAPTGVVATGISTSDISLTWNPSSDDVGVDHYQIFRNGNSVGTSPGNVTNFTDSGLNAGQTYTYSIYAWDASGKKNTYNVSQTAKGTTTSSSINQPPSAPMFVWAYGYADTCMEIDWGDSTDDTGIAAYEIWRDGGYYAIAGYGITSLVDCSLPAHTGHTYCVDAIDIDNQKGSQLCATGSTF